LFANSTFESSFRAFLCLEYSLKKILKIRTQFSSSLELFIHESEFEKSSSSLSVFSAAKQEERYFITIYNVYLNYLKRPQLQIAIDHLSLFI